MGKHVVYLRARDESELKAQDLDPGEWVRSIVRHALETRASNRKELFPAPDKRRESE